jgi:hypothetical protein
MELEMTRRPLGALASSRQDASDSGKRGEEMDSE